MVIPFRYDTITRSIADPTDTSSTTDYTSVTIIYGYNYCQTTSYDLDGYYVARVEDDIKEKEKKERSDIMCRKGWVNHLSFYREPNIKSIALRCVPLQGRGWANK